MENNSQLIIYQTEKGETKLEVRLENDGMADAKIDGGVVSNYCAEYQYAPQEYF